MSSIVLSDPEALTQSPPLTEPIRVKGQWGHLPPLNAFEPGRQEEGVRRAINIPWQLNQTLSQTDKCQIFMKMTRVHPSLLLPPSQWDGPRPQA